MHRSLNEKNIFTLSITKEDFRYFYVDIKIMRSGVNQNNWDYTQKSIDECAHTFLGTPILTAYKGQKIGGGHDFSRTRDRYGRMKPDFRGPHDERIVGIIENQPINIEIIDGEKWLILKGKLFKYYAEQLVEYLVRENAMDVSAETDVPEEYQEILSNGVERFHRFTGLGVTILGKGTAPAIDGSRIKALAESREFKEIQLKAASYKPNSKKDNSNKFSEKGGQKIMAKMTKKELKVLSDKFKGFGSILGYSTDGKFCAIMRNDQSMQFYPLSALSDEDENVKDKNFIAATLCLSATVLQEEEEGGEEKTITCAAEEVLAEAEKKCEAVQEEKKECEDKIETLEKEKTELIGKLATMEQQEKERRCEEMKNAFNLVREKSEGRVPLEERVSQEKCLLVIEEIDKGVFDNCLDTEGKFNGVNVVKARYFSMFGEKQAETMVAREAKKNTTLSWKDGNFIDGESQVNDVATLVGIFGVDLSDQ